MKNSLSPLLGALPLAAIAAFGCDNTVALDTTLPSLTEVYVSNVCPTSDDGDLELSVVLLSASNNPNKSKNLFPDSRVQKSRSDVIDLIGTDKFKFSFNLPSVAEGEIGSTQKNAYVTVDGQSNDHRELGLSDPNVNFDYVDGVENQSASPYMILLMDQSSSIIGQEIDSIDLTKATDANDQRLAFFKQLIDNMPTSYYASIISYKGDFDDATQEDNEVKGPISLNPNKTYETVLSEQGQKAEVSGAALLNKRLESFELKATLELGTPRIRALKSGLELAKNAINNPPRDASQGLRPVVVLFTDGVEGGDTSGASESIADIAAQYAEQNIPVHVVHLQPPPTVDATLRGRDAELAALACQTRGDYLFVPKASTFSESKTLRPILSNRLDGRWVLDVQSTFGNDMAFEPGLDYFLSTALQVTLGEETRTYSVSNSEDRDPSKDQRLWMSKE
jgi:hypothetical protein